MAIKIFCSKIVINKPELLQHKGPLLLAANHPNSFLDGIILTILFDQPVYALARGDAFKNKGIAKILRWLRQLPVYRTSEGLDNLKNNYHTFSECHQKFKESKIVIIFSEAASINEWRLRPLRKGTARLAIASWQQAIPLKVLPVGINYDSFKKFGKEVHINFGDIITKEIINESDSDGIQINEFNSQLNNQLEKLVYTIENKEQHKHYFGTIPERSKTLLLLLPAVLGLILHFPLYVFCLLATKAKFSNSDHYDSVLHSLMLLLYPFYIILLVILLWPALNFHSLWIVLISPFTAWCWQQSKDLFNQRGYGFAEIKKPEKFPAFKKNENELP